MFFRSPISKNRYVPKIRLCVMLFGFFMPPHGHIPVLRCTSICARCDEDEPKFAVQALLLVWHSLWNMRSYRQSSPHVVKAGIRLPNTQASGGSGSLRCFWLSSTKNHPRRTLCGCSCPCPAGTLFCAHEDFTRAFGNSWRCRQPHRKGRPAPLPFTGRSRLSFSCRRLS